jgi:hypothetical protein
MNHKKSEFTPDSWAKFMAERMLLADLDRQNRREQARLARASRKIRVQPALQGQDPTGALREAALERKLRNHVFNLSQWWGAVPSQAITVLTRMRDDYAAQLQAGTLQWPDPKLARYCPGTPDEDLRELATKGAAVIAAQGVRPSARSLWAWCRAQGARKRDGTALRIVGSVLACLSARAVAAAVVAGAVRPSNTALPESEVPRGGMG